MTEFNGHADPSKVGIPQKRPKGWTPSRAASQDEIDAAMERIVRDIMATAPRRVFPKDEGFS